MKFIVLLCCTWLSLLQMDMIVSHAVFVSSRVA